MFHLDHKFFFSVLKVGLKNRKQNKKLKEKKKREKELD